MRLLVRLTMCAALIAGFAVMAPAASAEPLTDGVPGGFGFDNTGWFEDFSYLSSGPFALRIADRNFPGDTFTVEITSNAVFDWMELSGANPGGSGSGMMEMFVTAPGPLNDFFDPGNDQLLLIIRPTLPTQRFRIEGIGAFGTSGSDLGDQQQFAGLGALQIDPIPEPGMLSLLATAGLALVLRRRRRK